MTFNLLNNPSGRRTTTGYTAFGGTIGQDAGRDAYVQATGSPTAFNLVLVLETMVVGGGKLLPSTTYTFSATIQGSATSVGLRVTGTGVATADTVAVAAGPFTRVSVTFTTLASGSIAFDLVNRSNAVAGNVIVFRDAMVEASSVMNAYYDGTTQNYMWSGAADNSPSWGPVVSVVPNPSFTPPRDEITCSLAPGSVMKTASLARIVNGVATQTLSQPSAGFDTQLVYDYLAPYGVPVSYEFVSDFVLPASVLWDETWSNLSAWTSTSGFSVSGGTVTGSGGPMSRAVTSGSYRVTLASLVGGSVGGVAFGSVLRIYANSAGFIVAVPIGLGGVVVPVTTPVSAGSPVTIDFFGSSVVISGTGGTYTINGYSSTDFSTVQISSSSSITVGELKLSAYSASSHTDSTSTTPATLSPTQAWLIHPASPSLSVPISSSDLSSIAIQDLGTVSQASSTTLHAILGQELPIATTSGPRYGNTQQVKLKTRTAAHEAALNGILSDGTPLLFRFPLTYDAGFDEGFYAVGTVQRERIAQKKGNHLRQFTLDITEVQQPTVIVQNAGWSWAALAAAFPTWQAVAQAFNTWADVLTNNRKPGY